MEFYGYDCYKEFNFKSGPDFWKLNSFKFKNLEKITMKKITA